MAKAASPIRLQEELMQAATLTAKRFHRSAAEQIEYWAELGRSVSSSLDPDVLLSVTSGLATIKIEPVYAEPVNPDDVFQALENERQAETLSQHITGSAIRYQASLTHPGYLEQIDQNGGRAVGKFQQGKFIALNETDC